MRLFVALEIPSAVRENLGSLLASVRAITKEPRWVRVENLHVTLKFLGEVAEEKIAEGMEVAKEAIKDGLAATSKSLKKASKSM